MLTLRSLVLKGAALTAVVAFALGACVRVERDADPVVIERETTEVHHHTRDSGTEMRVDEPDVRADVHVD